ncbi:MAG: seryl-tRNA synthetase [Solirubrobacterales bacterium]|nr:seryl-tRNA synthetase [Solirubrobacterales bacterium]
MLDLKLLREDPEGVKAALARRGPEAVAAVEELLELDGRRRELLPEIESRRARQNEANDAIATAKREGGDAAEAIAEMRGIAAEVKRLESELAEIESARDAVALAVPNPPDPTAPDGDSEEDAEVLREVGERPEFDFEPRDHIELCGERLIGVEKAARVSGARFAYLFGDLVMLELALVRFTLELLAGEGHMPVSPPVLVREEALTGTGFFPGDRETIYEIPRDELFLVGTSEVSLAALHMDEILDPGALPLRYAGFSTCFRREAGAAGKDTRGIFRVHQFDKVEMFSFVEADQSAAEHERLLGLQERILQALELPYRVVDIPVGDLGASAAKKYDCEAWIPSQGRYRELTSCSNTTDYQARRLRCRYRPGAEQPPRHPHTLNGTAVAVGRTLIALIENHQRADGSITVPSALHDLGAPERIGG